MQHALNGLMVLGIILVFSVLIFSFVNMDSITGKQYAPSTGGGGGGNTGNPLSIQDWCIDLDNGDVPGTPSLAMQERGYRNPVNIFTNGTNFTKVSIKRLRNDSMFGLAGTFSYQMPGSTKVYNAENFKILNDIAGQIPNPSPAPPAPAPGSGTTPSGSGGKTPASSGGTTPSNGVASSGSDHEGSSAIPVGGTGTGNAADISGSGSYATSDWVLVLYERVCNTSVPVKTGNPNIYNGQVDTKTHVIQKSDQRDVPWPFVNRIFEVCTPVGKTGNFSCSFAIASARPTTPPGGSVHEWGVDNYAFYAAYQVS